MRTCNKCNKMYDDSTMICTTCNVGTVPYSLTIKDIILYVNEDDLYLDMLHIIDVTAIFQENTIEFSGKYAYSDCKTYKSKINLDKYSEKLFIPRIVNKYRSYKIFQPSIKLKCNDRNKEPIISICFKTEDDRERVKLFFTEIDNFTTIKELYISKYNDNDFKKAKNDCLVDLNKILFFSLVRTSYSDEDGYYDKCDFSLNENNLTCKFYKSILQTSEHIIKSYPVKFIKILDVKNDLTRIFIGDFTLFLTEEQVVQLKSYCNNNEIDVIEKGLENENIVKQIKESLNETANIIGLNFLKLNKLQVLKSCNYYILLDADYSFNSLDLEFESHFNYYLDEFEFQFNEYVNLLKTDFNIDFKYCKEVAWLLLKDLAIPYYAEKWIEEYDKLVIGINKNNGNEYLQFICENDFVDLKNNDFIALLTYFFMYNNWFDKISNFASCYFALKKTIDNKLIEIKKNDFKNKLKRPIADIVTHYNIDDIDLMDGTEFENFISLLFSKMGYKSEVTKHSGDQGIDVIAEKRNYKIGIQTKCYSNSVGNSAIQEVVAGKSYYSCDKVIVITNNYFTNAAADLALANNVLLWDRNILVEKIKQYF